jgi:hypothetical protein
MRRIVVVSALAAALAVMTLQAQTPVSKPGPEHKKLLIWVGDWNYEAESQATPLGPAGKSVGKSTVRSVLGGYFVEWRGEEKGPAGNLRWYEVDGWDAKNKTYFWKSFGSDGSFQSTVYSIDGTKVSYSGTVILKDKEYKMRGTCLFSPDLTSFEERREISADGKTWMPNFVIKNVKAPKPPPKESKAK